MIRTCTGCGNHFETLDLRKKRCAKNCGRTDQNNARDKRRDGHILTFTGVDGEGVTRPSGEHVYDMLSVGSETLTNPDGSQLHWHQIFAFLWECYRENPHDTYAGFFLGYDFTQWFRTLPEDRAAMLLSAGGRALRRRTAPGTEHLGPFPVRADGWEFDILGAKRFKLRREALAGAKANGWMYINDTGPFFQQSFLAVIDPKGWDQPVCSDSEYAAVVAGKADRGTVADLAHQLDTRARTIRYNTLENDILARVLGRLNNGFVSAGVQLNKRQWYGPGQAAQTWLNRIEAPTAEHVQETVPRWALEAARDSYFGGWFEIFAHGHVAGTSHEYDINSAYPYVIAQLPCLEHGTWTRGRDHTRGPWTLLHATVQGTHPRVGAMPHREKDGRVLRPGQTRGWYWWHEIQAAQRAGVIDTLQVHVSIDYDPCDCPPPLKAEMEWLYQERLKVGKNSPSGKAMKLVYNSSYGKFAQSIGSPKYANPVYASLITAGTRTMILDTIASHPRGTQDLLMVATDGVYFRTPHPALELDPARLGAWDHQEKHNLTLFMPGVYWDDTTRQRLADGESPKLKSRGVSARDLAKCVEQLDTQFREFTPYGGWPSITIPVEFAMTTAVQALARGKWDTAGEVQTDGSKTLNADPKSKRAPALDRVDGVWRSYCWTAGAELDSTPYGRAFGMTPAQEEAEEGLNPETGSYSAAFREGLL